MGLLELSRKSARVKKMKIVFRKTITLGGETHQGFEVDLGDRIVLVGKLEDRWYCLDPLKSDERKRIFEILDFYISNDLQKVS